MSPHVRADGPRPPAESEPQFPVRTIRPRAARARLSPGLAWGVALVLLPLALAACGASGETPIFHAASGTPSATPSRIPSQPVVPSMSPSLAGSVAPAAVTVRNADWYLSRVPRFPPAPSPQKITVGPGSKAAFWYRVPTEQKVAFITIDDGGLTRTPEALALIRQARIPVTLFLTSPAASSHAPYFRQLEDTGAVVENHTITHTSLRGKSYDFQKNEICGAADRLGEVFGKRPTLFRPPFGEKDDVTLRAARDCGMRVAFYWTQTVDKGIVRYQTTEKVVRPGDVLLMHFRPALADDLLAALNAIHAAGLTQHSSRTTSRDRSAGLALIVRIAGQSGGDGTP